MRPEHLWKKCEAGNPTFLQKIKPESRTSCGKTDAGDSRRPTENLQFCLFFHGEDIRDREAYENNPLFVVRDNDPGWFIYSRLV